MIECPDGGDSVRMVGRGSVSSGRYSAHSDVGQKLHEVPYSPPTGQAADERVGDQSMNDLICLQIGTQCDNQLG
jgi:hypothetical protein